MEKTAEEKMRNFKARRNGTRVVFPARLSYVHLDAPWSGKEGNEPKYSVSAIIPKEDVQTLMLIREAIQAAYDEGVVKTWKGKRPNMESKNFKFPLKDRDTDRDTPDPAYAGKMFVGCNAKADRQPATLTWGKEKIDPKQVYSGCYGLVSVGFFAFDQGSVGISAGLNAVLKLYDGEPLGGSGDGSHDFDEYEGLDAPMDDDEDL